MHLSNWEESILMLIKLLSLIIIISTSNISTYRYIVLLNKLVKPVSDNNVFIRLILELTRSLFISCWMLVLLLLYIGWTITVYIHCFAIAFIDIHSISIIGWLNSMGNSCCLWFLFWCCRLRWLKIIRWWFLIWEFIS
jgi:hypothetical protein